MERRIYEPTEKQNAKWNVFTPPVMPSDDEFKMMWKKSHHGRENGWGMGKRNWIISSMSGTRDYQMGIWQGRVDKARGLPYSEERNENTYNLGYFRGYTEYESNRKGWDAQTRDAFDQKYIQ